MTPDARLFIDTLRVHVNVALAHVDEASIVCLRCEKRRPFHKVHHDYCVTCVAELSRSL